MLKTVRIALLAALLSFAGIVSSAQTADEMPVTRDLSSVVELGRIPVYFDHGSLQVKPLEADEIREIIRLLDEHKDYMIELYGWCSPASSDKVNEYRSFYRANAVGEYLVKNGLDGRRIIDIDGMGTDKSVTSKDMYDSARRVDIVIVRFKYD